MAHRSAALLTSRRFLSSSELAVNSDSRSLVTIKLTNAEHENITRQAKNVYRRMPHDGPESIQRQQREHGSFSVLSSNQPTAAKTKNNRPLLLAKYSNSAKPIAGEHEKPEMSPPVAAKLLRAFAPPAGRQVCSEPACLHTSYKKATFDKWSHFFVTTTPSPIFDFSLCCDFFGSENITRPLQFHPQPSLEDEKLANLHSPRRSGRTTQPAAKSLFGGFRGLFHIYARISTTLTVRRHGLSQRVFYMPEYPEPPPSVRRFVTRPVSGRPPRPP